MATLPIPQPPRVPLFGHIFNLDIKRPVQSLGEVCARYGPICRFDILKEVTYLIGSHELAADACDSKRFVKQLHRPLRELRKLVLDGLFTAYNDEINWGKAHRILMPAFGPQAMRHYFPDMLDVAGQMFTKWERRGDEAVIDLTGDMTRLTLDTIALCGMGYRFNSFYRDDMHPFVDAMISTLLESQMRSGRLAIQEALAFRQARRFDADLALMYGLTEEIIAQYRASPPAAGARHLLALMLNEPDPVTGSALETLNIQRQLITLLVAGHETTSGMLSFATYLLLEHPAIMRRARAVVDEVLGEEEPTFEHLAQLGYIEQILRESLRLHPTAPAFSVTNPEATELAGKYAMPANSSFIIMLACLHRDPAVWPNPDAFDPDRFSPERRGDIPPFAWMPFGNGPRACIGRVFTLQEATLVLAMLLQRFDLRYTAPYRLQIKETLTVKPTGLFVCARRRPRASRARPALVPERASGPARPVALNPSPVAASGAARHMTPLHILYGSNAGTCEALARRMAGDAAARGYAVGVRTLDEATDRLGTERAPLLIVVSSYNGTPPDNAGRFIAWSEKLPPASLAGVPVAVFGCGDHNWATTYQAVPRGLCEALLRAGAELVVPRGEGDAAANLFGAFESWYASLWPALATRLGIEAQLEGGSLYRAELTPPGGGATAPPPAAAPMATVLENRELVAMHWPMARSKRHLRLRLPPGLTYEPGDYLGVMPRNHAAQVQRAAARFGLRPDQVVVLRSQRGNMAASLPVDTPQSVAALLAARVELASPITVQDLERLAPACTDAPQRDHLEFLATHPDAFRAELGATRLSTLDVLEAYPAIALSFVEFLEFLPPMRMRQYSISSSPRRDPQECTLTVAVVDGPAPAGIGRFRGAASGFLAGLAVGDSLEVARHRPNQPFHPPKDNRRPMLLIGAGSGIAPLRGFIEDRALRAAAGEAAGRMALFFGCDHPEIDCLYRDEFAPLAAAGTLALHLAFSRQPVEGRRFVQDELWHARAEVATLLAENAQVFVCGSAQTVAKEAVATLARIHAEAAGVDAAAGVAWVAARQAAGDIILDVFG